MLKVTEIAFSCYAVTNKSQAQKIRELVKRMAKNTRLKKLI